MIIAAVDIETTDVIANAGIWQIGARKLLSNGEFEDFKFDVKLERNALIDESTMLWLENNGLMEAYHRSQVEGNDLMYVLKKLYNFLEGNNRDRNDVIMSWGNFDFPLLEYWYRNLNFNDEYPWHYAAILDMRGVGKFFQNVDHSSQYFPKVRPNSTHNAWEDAKEVLDLYLTLHDNIETLINR